MSNKTNSTIFITNYILSLAERTRHDKKGMTLGFDWVIYNLAIAKNWDPLRLPFTREKNSSTGKTKTEAEFGIDMAFLSKNKDKLYIFVLKDEKLNRKNWTGHSIDTDLRLAMCPDLSSRNLSKIRVVTIILAYNKDEDNTGVEIFRRFTKAAPSKIKNKISLSFERWNLTRIVEEVSTNLLSPDLLPQHLSGLLNYISMQVADFHYGSSEWVQQLLPNWKNFLATLLKEPTDERRLRLVPVTLLILYKNKKDVPDSYPGWIDLMEWAMLSLWECYRSTASKKIKAIIIQIWIQLYVAELERYFIEISPALTAEHGLHSSRHAMNLVPINDAYITYWHLGRLGVLTLAPQDFIADKNKEGKSMIADLVYRSSDWLLKCLRANPSTMRPLIDLNHIELFLIWLILWQSGKEDEIYKWLSELENRLLTRRIRNASLPFIEGRNRMDLVAEYAATSTKPYDFTDNSSYLLLMVLELCCALPEKYRDELLRRYFNRIIKGIGDDDQPLADFEIDLIGWAPPEDWGKRILHEPVTNGVAITTNNFHEMPEGKKQLYEKIKNYVDQSREKFPFVIPKEIPKAVFILASIKNKSPLPPDFWRNTIFTEK